MARITELRIEVPQYPPYTMKQFSIGANISRSYLYNLPEDMRPRWAKIKGRRFIIESPIQWLERIEAHNEQAQQTST